MHDALASGLAGAYAIERELGRGGMATVYLAHDLKHERPVALKVLHPDIAATLGPERFRREITTAARLQHPHVLTVHDSGETSGLLWFTMPYVEGESVRDRLNRERQLPVDDAVRIAREAAQALHYAHTHGVIHRDIKPENLLLTADGTTLVADFGIARAFGGPTPGGRLTETGMAVGTPAYMSPEQASGERDLDARSDIYSLGAVLFEMLAGEPPFSGATTQAMLAKRFTESAPSVRRVRPSVPPVVDEAIQRALAPVPADRWPTAAQFAQALATPTATASTQQTASVAPSTRVTTPGSAGRATGAVPASASRARRRIPAAALTLALGFLIGVGVLFALRRSTVNTTAGQRVIAVLPFQNMGDSADAYFADGVTEEVRGKLSHIPGLEVIARTSSEEYRHTAKRPQDIARELGADYLLTATVRWEKSATGNRVRVTPELVDVGPGHAPRTRWQEAFDASLTDVFQVQADIAGKVANALDVALGDSTRHEIAAKPTNNLAAYDAFLKGEAATQGITATDPPALRRAIAFYEQAVALDSTFVPAWAQLARVRSFLYFNSTPDPAIAAAARQAAERALALAPTRAEGHLALGYYYGAVAIDIPKSLAEYELGLKAAPTNVELLVGAALAEESLNRWDDALAHLQKASSLDPRSPITARRTASSLVYLHRIPEALIAANRAMALSPNNLAVIEDRTAASLAAGDLTDARNVVHTAFATIDSSAVLAYFGVYQDLYWLLEDAAQRKLLTLPASAFDNDRGNWGIVRAQTYALRGDQALARVWADTARVAIEEQLRAAPGDGQRTAFLGLALAYLGRKNDAIAAGQRAMALLPMTRDAYFGVYIQHQMARIYLLVGEPEKALDLLESLVKSHYLLTPAWLRIDPNFAPLKGNPRFERLIASS